VSGILEGSLDAAGVRRGGCGRERPRAKTPAQNAGFSGPDDRQGPSIPPVAKLPSREPGRLHRGNRLDQTRIEFFTLPTHVLTGQHIMSSEG